MRLFPDNRDITQVRQVSILVIVDFLQLLHVEDFTLLRAYENLLKHAFMD